MTYTIPEGRDETKKYDELDLKIKLNISAVRLSRHKYRDAINYCQQVRREDKDNQKATYRKAIAHLELNEFDLAEEEIDLLISQNGTKSDIDQLSSKLKQYVSYR
jgi:tetratricopeptide (TPR) repeat protein